MNASLCRVKDVCSSVFMQAYWTRKSLYVLIVGGVWCFCSASAQAAAAALSCLFNPSFSRATSQDDAGGEEIDVGREEINLSAETTGVLARAVISIGANCAHNSLQQRAASSCLCDLARLQLPVVLYVVLAADWLDAPGGGSSKSAAERR
jgi:hypothetical protein